MKENQLPVTSEFEEGVRAVTMIRCIKCLDVPQQNTNEMEGAECGGCIAKERDRLRESVKRLEKIIRNQRNALKLAKWDRHRKL